MNTQIRNNISLNDLLNKVKEKDEIAFGELFKILAPAVTEYINRRFPDLEKEIVESIAIDTLSTIWFKAENYYGTTDFQVRSWAYKISYFEALNYLQKERKEVPAEQISDFDNIPSESNDIHDDSWEVGLQRIEPFLDSLTQDEKRLFNTLLEGYSMHEIALRSNQSPSMLRVRISRLRNKFAHFVKSAEVTA
ncbi:MAG: hypothetical protein C3F13_02750 [Anaerolineales bacterium]|nr:MAG: hypothetical protein C3F13_02750 [Anaerolineales bacterium]